MGNFEFFKKHSSESETATDSFDESNTITRNKNKILTFFYILIVVASMVFIAAVVSVVASNDNASPLEINSVGIRMISFSDKSIAEYVLESWENGKATEASMIDIMYEHGLEQGGGKLYIVTNGEYAEEIVEWCFSSDREIGDYAIIKSAYGYSLCYISSFNESPTENNALSYKELGVTLEQYMMATMIADNPLTFCGYIAELKDTLAKGTYDSNLKMEKASNYVDNLPIDVGQKIILLKIQFPKITAFNDQLIAYLNGRDDIDNNEKVYILEELGFAVFADGTVKW